VVLNAIAPSKGFIDLNSFAIDWKFVNEK